MKKVILLFMFLLLSSCSVQQSTTVETTEIALESKTPASSWIEQGVIIEGRYADVDAVALGDGTYRLYFGVKPEVKGNQNKADMSHHLKPLHQHQHICL